MWRAWLKAWPVLCLRCGGGSPGQFRPHLSIQPEIEGATAFAIAPARRADWGRVFLERGFMKNMVVVFHRKGRDGTLGLAFDDGDFKGKLHRDAGMKGRVKIGATEAQAGEEGVVRSLCQGEVTAGDLNLVLAGEGFVGLKLQPMHGGIHKSAGGATFERGFAQQGPAFESFANGELGLPGGPGKQLGETPFPDRSIGGFFQRKSVASKEGQDGGKIIPEPLRQEIFIAEAGAKKFERLTGLGVEEVGGQAGPE